MKEPNRDVVEALHQVRARPQWKLGRDLPHLRKRQRKGHLPTEASIKTYDQLIQGVLQTSESLVYRYPVRGRNYYAVRGKVDDREWLVIFDAPGVLETAFPPTDIDEYLSRQGFEYVGTIGELLL
jgi:hypothetical protein